MGADFIARVVVECMEGMTMKDIGIRIVGALIVVMVVAGCGRPEDHPAAETESAAWTTVATLTSGDEPWQDIAGILVSKPFEATGEVQVVMEVPDGGQLEGVIAVIVPAEQMADHRTLMTGIRQGESVMLVGAQPTQVVTGLEGSFVLVNAVPSAHDWTLTVQTR